ncbi:MAG TPA: hypothetical protein VNZ52_14555 [Candidatus Thermoplasmatota archaeon]|nr:hypothetical protein [Candidatus Thermoplasmatota archaeon]
MLPRPLATLLVVAASLAGCLTPAATEPLPADPASGAATPGPAPTEVLNLTGCLQFHTYYRNPVQPFAQFVPEGFRIETQDPAGQTFDLRVGTSLCENVSEMVVSVPVIPPEGLATEGALFEEVPVVMHVTAGPLFEYYRAAGLEAFLRESRFPAWSVNELTGVTRRDEITVEAEGEEYVQRTTLQASSDTFRAELYVLWVPENGTAAKRLLVDNTESAEVGFGTATLQYTGNGGAPPLASGIAHVVQGVGMSFRKEAIA